MNAHGIASFSPIHKGWKRKVDAIIVYRNSLLAILRDLSNSRDDGGVNMTLWRCYKSVINWNCFILQDWTLVFQYLNQHYLQISNLVKELSNNLKECHPKWLHDLNIDWFSKTTSNLAKKITFLKEVVYPWHPMWDIFIHSWSLLSVLF